MKNIVFSHFFLFYVNFSNIYILKIPYTIVLLVKK